MQDFSTALQAWKEVHLDTFHETIIDAADHIGQAHERSIVARQHLAERTREFKRQPADVQLQDIRALLKQYQAEIDALTSRAKQSEAAVLDVQKRFKSVPDPYPILEALVDATIHEQDLSQMRAHIVQLQLECSEWEQRCMTAEERLRLSSEDEAKSTQLVDEAIASTTQRFQRQQERLEHELKAAHAHIRELRESHEFMTSRLGLYGDPSLDQSQVDAWMHDIERAKERASKAEAQVVHMHTTLQRQHESQAKDMQDRIAVLESQLTESHRERTLLEQEQAKVETLRAAMLQQQDTYASAAKAWEQERAALQRPSDHGDMQQNLEDSQTCTNDAATESTAPLQVLSVQEHPLANETTTDRSTEREKLIAERTRLSEALASEKAKVQQLESDLSQRVSTTGGAVGLLPVVTSQRDRFRSRTAELEQELQNQSHMLQELREQLSSARATTRGLQEKLRTTQDRGSHDGDSSAVDMPYPGGIGMHLRDSTQGSDHPWEPIRSHVRGFG
ncbi:hypothetical protein MEQU1_000783 [Malassezia equina]|uniref:Protein CASP n=1 Tax=Malassezia equina TaxID=1381935 RepID=A0AAF0ECG6_9BASI|nr:hypothetical protein MEQU1_000783 [Malassezia equina]